MKTRLLTLCALAVMSGAAQAQTAFPPPPPPTLSGPYVGATVGAVTARNGCVGVLSGGGRSCDDSAVALGAFGGYQLNRYLAAEIAFRDLGRVRATGTTTENIHTRLVDVTALGMVPIAERFSAFARLGGYHASQDTSVGGVGKQESTNLTYGGGLQWDFIGGLGVRAEWQRYKRVGKERSFYDLNYYDVLGVGVTWRFK